MKQTIGRSLASSFESWPCLSTTRNQSINDLISFKGFRRYSVTFFVMLVVHIRVKESRDRAFRIREYALRKQMVEIFLNIPTKWIGRLSFEGKWQSGCFTRFWTNNSTGFDRFCNNFTPSFTWSAEVFGSLLAAVHTKAESLERQRWSTLTCTYITIEWFWPSTFFF